MKTLKVSLSVWEKNRRKYIVLSVTIKKENENGKPRIYKIKFIDNVKFISSSLSSLAESFSEGLHQSKCKNWKSGLDYVIDKCNTLIFECAGCNKSYEKVFNEDLTKRFQNSYKF